MNMSQTFPHVGFVRVQVLLKKYFDLFALEDEQEEERQQLADKQRDEREQERDRLDAEEDEAHGEREEAQKKERDAQNEKRKL